MKSQLFTVALALAPHALATAWPGWLPDIDSLVVRQDATTTAESTAQETGATNTDASNTNDATSTGDNTATATDDNQPETTNLNTGGITSTGTRTGGTTGTGTGTNTKGTSKSTHKTFDAQDGAGGVAMITPATTDGTTLYRIDNTVPITWVWNYTSLQASPSAIDVMISCSTVSATWTLTQNMTFAPTATFTWDSNKFQESNIASPLVVEQYTLLIIDADSSVSATAEPGYLAPFDGFQFGMYTSRPYEDLGEWKCATCNAASGDLDRTALGFAVTMSIITVFSFTWYVTGIAALL